MMQAESADAIERAADLVQSADAVVLAASNGFDIADGYNQFASDEAFLRHFGDFRRAYGIDSILQGLMARWPSWEERWAFLARVVSYGYGAYRPSPVMEALDRLTSKMSRFVITCNCNGRFERAGFDPQAIFETEGSFARLRCTDGCADEDYAALSFVEKIHANILSEGSALAVPSGLVPRCPRCGAPLDIAVDDTGRLAATALFRAQQQRFQAFLADHRKERILIIELGIGQANRAIKAPLMRFAEDAPCVGYLVLNRDEALLPRGLGDRAVAVRGDLAPAFDRLVRRLVEPRP